MRSTSTPQAGKNKRALLMASGLATAALAVAGCGVSVASGNENAATHPASGIFDSNTVGGGEISQRSTPMVTYTPPSNKAPSTLPAGLAATTKAIEAAVKGGCWQDSRSGNVDGAYDQLFWWQGDCGDTIGAMTVELFATAAKAKAEDQHPSSSALLARYLDGAALVDVFSNAPLSVLSSLSTVKGLQALPGYNNS